MFYVGTTIIFLCPPSPTRQRLLSPFYAAIEYLGLWQYYAVFAPARTYNLYLEGEVELENGKLVSWKYPRIESMNIFDKMQKERFRKLYNDIANEPSESILWPELARYIGRQVYLETKVRPVRVGLVRFWADIPEPDGSTLPKPVTIYKSHKYFTFPIQPEDLG